MKRDLVAGLINVVILSRGAKTAQAVEATCMKSCWNISGMRSERRSEKGNVVVERKAPLSLNICVVC